MGLSALESISKALEKSLDFWGLLLLLSTAVVVLGLTVEYWHDVKEFWAVVRWPMASFPWFKFKTLAGGILVTLGVAGEFFFTYEASRVETDLRNNNHKIEALLTKEADEAAKAGGEANERAEEMKDAIAPRRITPKERMTLASGLSRFSKQPVVAYSNPFDAEASILAAEILASLKSAKWDTTSSHWSIGRSVSSLERAPSIPVTGIFVDASPEKRSKSAAKALVRALTGIGLDCSPSKKSIGGFDPIRSRNERLVVIGVEARPEGPQGEAKVRAEAKMKQANNIQTTKP
jgi:hypothetical protein